MKVKLGDKSIPNALLEVLQFSKNPSVKDYDRIMKEAPTLAGVAVKEILKSEQEIDLEILEYMIKKGYVFSKVEAADRILDRLKDKKEISSREQKILRTAVKDSCGYTPRKAFLKEAAQILINFPEKENLYCIMKCVPWMKKEAWEELDAGHWSKDEIIDEIVRLNN